MTLETSLAWAVVTVSLVALIAGVVLGLWGLTRPERSRSRAAEILSERLARGEIDTDEYRDRLGSIQGTEVNRRPRVAWTALGLLTVGVIGTVGGGAWAGTSSWGVMRQMMGGDMGSMMSMMQSGPTERSGRAPEQGASELRVVSREFSFSPSEIVVRVGATTNIELENQGHMFHTFTVPELGFELRARSGESIDGALVTESPGTYEFICAVPQHADMGMRGRIVVSSK